MIGSRLSQRAALWIFILCVVFILAQAVWWIVFIAELTNEKVDMAQELGGSPEFVEQMHRQEIGRQIMIGMEGIVFLLLLLIGIWLIYRSLVHAQQVKRHEQNFLMAVTHELKTPLASLRLYLDALQSPKVADEKKRDVLPRMRQDLARLERLVEDILQAGRFDRASFHLVKEPVDLTALVQAAANERKAMPFEKPIIQMRVELKSGLVVDGDTQALRRAVDAILDNAFKYTGDNKMVDVRVCLKEQDGQAHLTISDNGVGLERAELDRVFDRFYRVGNEMTRTSRGSGLGLFLCREMIRLHGGDVTARSEGLGRGSEFEIVLPLRVER